MTEVKGSGGTEGRGVAIIGMACRFPGASDLDGFWSNLVDGVDCIRHFTDEELKAAGVPEATLLRPEYVKAAPVVDDFDKFDAGFFEYSPREARMMDPQQRLLLEEAYHAMEDAGVIPGDTGRRVGAFMGSGGVVTSYLLSQTSLHGSATGSVGHLANDKDFLSTKLSYKLGLTGPSINVQTACSTSLVATHLACQSILDGDCDIALAGAATVRVPQIEGYLHRAGDIMSPDGRCRAYDAAAEGTVFGSGAGVVVLKHLEDALADGDRIYAVILGSAVNNDGGEKLSYTASSTDGQARAMAAAFAAADVEPSTIGYVEGHGTGTVVGDPLEVEALRRCFATDPKSRAGGCWLGSVKTNIGHLEQTAGVASLIKAALALSRGKVPPSLNFKTPNPRIDFDGGPFRIPTGAVDWPDTGEPRRAAVNSLGLGGTNAFAILQEPPARSDETIAAPVRQLLALSARSPAALGELTGRWQARLAQTDEVEATLLCSAALQRTARHEYRRAYAGADASELIDALATDASPVRAKPGRKLAFLFPGQGAQYPGMARELHGSSVVFRNSFDALAVLFREIADLDIAHLVFQADDAEALANTAVAQPAIFAIELALADMLTNWGIRPNAVLGHSVGAYAAFVVAGIYTRDDAARLIARRAELMAAEPPRGAMAAIFAAEDEIAGLIDGQDGVRLAAANSPVNTVVAGEAQEVSATIERAEAAGLSARRLAVSHAFHSHLMEPVIAPFAEFAADFAASTPIVTFVSDHTGKVMTEAPDGSYLAQHVRDPVRFADSLQTLLDLGFEDFIEVGPGTALRGFVSVMSPGTQTYGVLDPKSDDVTQAVNSLGMLWARGFDVDPSGLYGSAPMPEIAPPSYPFARDRYWLESDGLATPGDASLLGPPARMPGPSRQHQAGLSLDARPWLTDHRVYGAPTLPVAAALIGLARVGATALGGPAEVRDLTYQEALLLASDEERRILHTSLSPDEDGFAAIISSQAANASDTADWSSHIAARIAAVSTRPVQLDLDSATRRCSQKTDVAAFYRRLDQFGLNYGPLFRNIRALQLGPGEALAEVAAPAGGGEAGDEIHPAFVDACLHVFPALSGLYGDFRGDDGEDATFLPITVERFHIHGTPPSVAHVRATRRPDPDSATTDRYTIDIEIADEKGMPVAVIGGLTVKRLRRDQFLPRRPDAVENWLYGVDWRSVPPLGISKPDPGAWLIVGETPDTVSDLVAELREAGQTAEIVRPNAICQPGFAPEQPNLRGVILATSLSTPALLLQSTPDLAAAQKEQFDLSQAALNLLTDTLRDAATSPRLWMLTRGAHAPLADHLGGEAMQAVQSSHGRVIALEHPNIWGGQIDIDHQTDAALVAAELLAPDSEDQIAIRAGRRYAPRLVRRPTETPSPAPIRNDRSYLVTGGLGSLGMMTAKWLAERGAGHIWLVGRRAPDATLQAEIEALGVPAPVRQVDVTDPASVAALIRDIEVEGPSLDGVFHCAGGLDDGIMIEMDWPKYHRITAAKIEGAWNLHQATEQLPLGHFVMYSSILSVIGSMGQLNYVAGNAFLDALVAHRQRLGKPALAMNWGPWDVEGLATDAGERGRAIWRSRGTEYIPATSGLEAMERAISSGLDHAFVTLTDWSRFVRQFPSTPPFYSELAGATGGGAARIALDRDKVLEQLAETPVAERIDLLIAALGEICAVNLELPEPPAQDLSLREAGLDSLMAITVINDIESVFGVRLEARAMLSGPSIEELAVMVFDALPAELRQAGPSGPSPVTPRPAPRRSKDGHGRWLVTRKPRPDAAIRIFCFPFAGGGSAVFDSWGDAFDPSIEVVAVEPPGRLERINEPPVRTVEEFARSLLPELVQQLDRPYAVLGHCLGGLTLYETLRFLDARGHPGPQHIFVSGARPPSVLRAAGEFERELDSQLQDFSAYRAGRPGYEQADEVLAEIVRAFGITDSAKMLDQIELRELILPTVRAEFEMASRYVYLPEGPFSAPITCFRGAHDGYFSATDAQMWRKFTKGQFELFTRDTGHFAIVEDFDFIHRAIEERLLAACAAAA